MNIRLLTTEEVASAPAPPLSATGVTSASDPPALPARWYPDWAASVALPPVSTLWSRRGSLRRPAVAFSRLSSSAPIEKSRCSRSRAAGDSQGCALRSSTRYQDR